MSFFKKIVIVFALVCLAIGCQKSSPVSQDVPTPVQFNGTTVSVLMKHGVFDPPLISVAKGTKVIFKNDDTSPHWPASNPHPTHDIYPEFDPLKNVDPGSQWEFIFGKVGTWRYHDHLNSTVRGTVIVTN